MVSAIENPDIPAPPAKSASRKSGWRTFTTVAIVLLVLGAGTWWGFLRLSDADSANRTDAPSGRTVLPLDAFTVNLADHEDGRFLRATLALGVDGQLPAITKGENKQLETGQVPMATIRDSILTVLAQCTSEQLLTPDGKVKLKADLINSLNRDVPDLRVREVYFTEFLVQR